MTILTAGWVLSNQLQHPHKLNLKKMKTIKVKNEKVIVFDDKEVHFIAICEEGNVPAGFNTEEEAEKFIGEEFNDSNWLVWSKEDFEQNYGANRI